MNESMFSLGEDISIQILYSEAFDEFCNDLDMMESVIRDSNFYFEVVVNSKRKGAIGKLRGMKVAATKNAETVGQVYGDITDAGAEIYKLQWNIVSKTISAISKIALFLVKAVTAVPQLIIKAYENILQMPVNAIARLKGDINLYITAEDIEVLYNSGLFSSIDQFMSYAQSLSNGSFWSAAFYKKDVGEARDQSDMKLCKNMGKIFKNIQKVQFHQRPVNMKNPRNRSIYFGMEKNIKFQDLSRKHHECTYYEALRKIMRDISEEQKKLKDIDAALGKKYDLSRNNETFAKLSPGLQRLVVETLQQTSAVVVIVGNIVRYAATDIKNIDAYAKRAFKAMEKDKANADN